MKNTSVKTSLVLSLSAFMIGFSASLSATSSIQLDSTLTDKYASGKAGDAKEVFSKDTPMIYIIWKSDQVKEGQKIKSVWIADDTNNVAPANFKIDEAEFVLSEGMKGKILSHLPGTFWDGKFTMSKPNNGWPLGKYHADIYVDSDLVKTVKFSIADAAPSTADATSWGAIAVDTASHDKDQAFGVGGGSSKAEADKNAQKFCVEAGGDKCNVVISYEQCGAYAVSKDHVGVGLGASKKISEEQAKSACSDEECSIVTSDCN